MSRLIIVSNRLPMSVDDTLSVRQNVGGLATAIGPLHRMQRSSLWVGWAGLSVEDRDPADLRRVAEAYEAHRCVPVFLTAEQVAGYYDGFSNGTIWPLFHDFAQEATFDPDTWRAYRQVNAVFADALDRLVGPGDTVWIQDYQLMLLPALVRARHPDARIGWFLHIPFPSPEIFRQLPWGRELLDGTLGADLIGFHTVEYERSFLGAVHLLADATCDGDGSGRIRLPDGRTATADAFPIGIDYGLYRRTAQSGLAKAMRHGIEAEAGKRSARRYVSSLEAESEATDEAATHGDAWAHSLHDDDAAPAPAPVLRATPVASDNKVIVSVDRLDYTKGIPARLRAYDMLLDRYPEWRGHVTYYLVATPSRQHVGTYQRLEEEVDRLVGRINGRYSMLSWTPIHFITRSLPIKPICGIYAAGDVALITPLRDGMNLVAKEYLACHDGRDGALVLSALCGAADELTEAFLVNPYDTDALCETLHDALMAPPEETRRRNLAMQARLRFATARTWARQFLSQLRQVTTPALADRRFTGADRMALRDRWDHASRRLVLCDYDGTLTPLVRTPDRARPTRQILETVRRLATRPGVTMALVSGRDRDTMARWFGALPVTLIAEHGAWRSDAPAPGGERTWQPRPGLPDPAEWMPRVEEEMRRAAEALPGALVERKTMSIAWHYRLCEPQEADDARRALLSRLMPLLADSGLAVSENAKVVEVGPAGVSKGEAIAPLLRDVGLPAAGDDATDDDGSAVAVAIGDDRTDETMFAAMPEGPGAWTFTVGAGTTSARHRLLDPGEVRTLLGFLTAESDASR